MSHMFHQVLSIIAKPPSQRGVPEIEFVLPWIRKYGDLLQDMGKNVLIDILQNCDFKQVDRDDVIIRQGEIGDCFYLILNGSAVVYIDPNLSGEEDRAVIKTEQETEADDRVKGKEDRKDEEDGTEGETDESRWESDEGEAAEVPKVEKKKKIDRSSFGKFIVKYESGKSFGEIALISQDSVRNATVLADETSDLLIIHRDLYNRSLKAFQEEEYADRRDFVENHSLFGKWSPRFRHLLEMSMRREVFTFDATIVKQGEEFSGLYFIRRGHAKVMVTPNKHKHQYKELAPFVAENDVFEVELLRPKRKNSRLQDDLSKKNGVIKESVMARRRGGYAAAEKQMSNRSIMLCSVEDGDCIGDVELLMDLSTYMQSVVCTSQCEVYILDVKNLERLVAKKNPHTLELMKFGVITKLRSRSRTVQGAQVPFLKHLLFRMTEYREPQPRKLLEFKSGKELPDKETLDQVLLEAFIHKKASLLRPYVPDALYYKQLMDDKVKKSQSVALSMSLLDRMALRAGKYPRRRHARSIVTLKDLQRQTEARHRRVNEDTQAQRALEELVAAPTPAPQSPEKWRTQSEIDLRDLSPNSNTDDTHIPDPMLRPGRKQLSMSVPDLRVTSANEIVREVDVVSEHGVEGLRPVREVTEPSLSRENSKVGSEKNADNTPGKDTGNGSAKDDENKSSQLSTQDMASPPISRRVSGDATTLAGFVESSKSGGETVRRNSIASAPDFKADDSEKMSRETPAGEKENNSILVTELITKPQDELDGRTSVNSGFDIASQRSHSAHRPTFAKMKFVNGYVQHRMRELERNPEYHDWETSEHKLRGLEERVQAFTQRYTKKDAGEVKPKKSVLPPLKRYKVKEDLRLPKPGGRVVIKRKQCHFANCKYTVKDHNHTKYHMVRNLPEMDKIKKTQVVVNYFMLRAVEKKTRRKSEEVLL
ncbi:uncharacterized protein LOC135500428 [Lineus longissimus]|uniref:uncharacterized protein LOC135500428 n=1 Tax=Lineus longissimus TaxID=88925 RepID=UPI002B4D61B0